jgi:hypothetical protein
MSQLLPLPPRVWVSEGGGDEPLVLGPELAIARIPAPVSRSSGRISSSLREKKRVGVVAQCVLGFFWFRSLRFMGTGCSV